jgi:hypothetical protein
MLLMDIERTTCERLCLAKCWKSLTWTFTAGILQFQTNP